MLRRIAFAIALCFAFGVPGGAFAAATDNFSAYNSGLDSPPGNGALVSPNDSVDLTNVSRACIVATAGDVKVTTLGGQTLVIPSVTAGQFLPFRFTRIWSTGTTASNISCWW